MNMIRDEHWHMPSDGPDPLALASHGTLKVSDSSYDGLMLRTLAAMQRFHLQS